MATYTIAVDEKKVEGKKFLDFIKTLPFVSFTEPNKMCGLDEALEDIQMGRIFEIKNWNEFSEQMEREALSEI